MPRKPSTVFYGWRAFWGDGWRSHVQFQILSFLAIKLVPYWNLSHQLFNPRLSSLVPLNIVLVECKKHFFWLQKHQGRVFSEWKSPRQRCTTQKSGLGMQQQIGYHNPNIQISSLEVPVGMVDGILTKLRNPVNQDLWLTDRFSTSVNHPLCLSLSCVSLVICT